MNFSESLLALVVQYTPIVVPISMFLGGLGIPLPNSMITIVLGTLVQQSLLRVQTISWLVLVPTILGDMASFHVAKRITNSQQLPKLARLFHLQPNGTERARAQWFFDTFGPLSIFLSRFAITPLVVPINMLAASTNYPFRSFVFWAILGESVWAVLYTAIGYYFGVYWQEMYQLLNNLIGFLSMMSVVAVILVIHRRKRKNAKLKSKLLNGANASV